MLMPKSNALIHEKSPYLQQHAHNPVDWQPWGEAAFEQARREEKPIFLSIGYSTCHWCHVMERESFEDDATAAVMNRHFVNIKVDREERPDVDRVYMTYVQATTGSGGWPMSVFLTPELKPFYGGTYFPPADAYGRPGFTTLLTHLAEAWQNDRAGIEQSGTRVMEALAGYTAAKPSADEVEWDAIIDNCFEQLRGSYDARHGGFGGAPKFPRPVQHLFLHRYGLFRDNPEAIEISRRTLRAMVDGGMHDHLGGGFHRYSVDAQWIVSHFEKMLYDQAQLVLALLEMYQLTGEPWCADAARDTCDYVLRDLTHPGGGFYAAEDADSLASAESKHKDEGAFYVWTESEIEAILTADEARVVNASYGIKPKGNAPSQGDPHGELRGKNILHLASQIDTVAEQLKLASAAAAALLKQAKAKLLVAREGRPRPHRDEKIICAWNGLMIWALSRAALVLAEPAYAAAAERAASFVRAELYDGNEGTLLRHYCGGPAAVPGFADDYAFMAKGMFNLFEATSDVSYLDWSEALLNHLNENFFDPSAGGYFASAPDPNILLRMKEDYDGAEPSAGSLAVMVGLELGHLLDRPDLIAHAKRTMSACSDRVKVAASTMPALLAARLTTQTPPLHIVIAGDPAATSTQALRQAALQPFLPQAIVLVANHALAERLPFTAAMNASEGLPAAYVCQNFACQQPMTEPDDLQRMLLAAPGYFC